MDEIYFIFVGIVILCISLCLTVVWLLSVCGVLQSVEVGAGSPPIEDVVLAYKFAKGPYKNAGELFSEITRIAPKYKCLGIYYDNPNEIPQEKLRYAVGAILGEGKVKVEKEVLDLMEAEGLKIIRLPAVGHCVKTSFPYINVMSILIAVWKVYPAMNRYIKEHRLCAYPMLEIYESDAINFMAPLSQQEDFYVPESKECIPDEYKNTDEGDSLIDTSRGSPSMYDSDCSDSSRSRSVSAFSSASRSLFETFSGDGSDIEEERGGTPSDIQDDDISSTVEVRASKACTNLLDESITEPITDESEIVQETGNSSGLTEEGIDASLQDSGICSGRASIVPGEMSPETRSTAEADGEDSSSSFEEIHVEETLSLPTAPDKSS